MNGAGNNRSARELPESGGFGTIHRLNRMGVLGAPEGVGQGPRLGRFEILRELGAGSMGLVFLARDPASSAEVALKVLKPEFLELPRAMRHFRKEIALMRGLEHPHILKILEVNAAGRAPYFVTPYCERGSLARQLEPGRPLAAEAIVRWGRQIAGALGHAHARGIIHRDLKPSNVLIDAQGNARLADFGLARTVFNDSLLEGTQPHCVGTAPYMSPGVARGEAEDTRCDIYAFGAVLYEMLTGELPYAGHTPQEIQKKIIDGPPRRILELNPGAPAGLARIAEGAMAREHRDRYADMADVAGDLERVERGVPPVGGRGERREEGGGRMAGGAAGRRGAEGEETKDGGGTLAPALTLGEREEQRRRKWVGGVGRFWTGVGLAGVVLGMALAMAGRWSAGRKVEAGTGAAGLPEKAGPRLELVKRFRIPEIWNYTQARVGHWASRVEPALLLVNAGKFLVVSTEGYVVDGRSWPPGVEVIGLRLLDLEGDGLNEVAFAMRSGGEVGCSIWNQNFFELKRYTAQGLQASSTNRAFTGSTMMVLGVAELEPGRRVVLAQMNNSRPPKPRGLYCFDFESQGLLWKHLMGPTVLWDGVQITDFEGDGKKEIIVGTQSVDNGNTEADGSDDAHSYVYAFNQDGKVRWRREVGGVYTWSYPVMADLAGTGRPQLLVWGTGADDLWREGGLPERGPVLVLGAEGETIASQDFGIRLNDCRVVDLEGDGRPEILVTDRNGFLHVLDAQLKVRRTVSVITNRFDRANLTFVGVAELTGDGKPDLVLKNSTMRNLEGPINPGIPSQPMSPKSFHDNLIIVLDNDLRELARHVVAEKWEQFNEMCAELADTTGDGVPEIIVLEREVKILQFKR